MCRTACITRPRRSATRILTMSAVSALAIIVLAGCGGSSGGDGAPTGSAGGQNSAYSARFQEFPVPVSSNVPADPATGCWPDDLAVDDQGSIWFGEHHADEIGRLVPVGSGYVYHGYPVPTRNSQMDSLALDPARHRVWVSENVGNRLALLDSGAAMPQAIEFPVTTGVASDPVPGDLAIDSEGNPWFTSPYEGDSGSAAPNALGKLDMSTGQVSYFRAPTASGGLDGLALDQAGALWFAEIGANRLGRYAQGRFTEFVLPRSNAGPTNLAVDRSGRVWVTEQTGNAVAVFDPADTTGRPWREVPTPTPDSGPVAIAIDGLGNVWFTEFTAGKIGLIPAGGLAAVDFAIPTPNSGPEDIRAAPDGRIFFTERYGNKIGLITLAS